MYGAPGICTEHEARTKHKAKTMKKYLAKFAVLACVACFAVSSQSEAACLHVNLNMGKARVSCVEKHRHEARHHQKHKHHCCQHDKIRKHRHHVARNRKAACCRGHR